MPWLRLTLTSHETHADSLGELLGKFSPAALSFKPASAEPVFGEGDDPGGYWERTSVSALFQPDVDLDIVLACARNQLGSANLLDCRVEAVADEDWVESHKAAFSPRVFGGRLCVCPSWHKPPPGVDGVIELDPGLAFGTGSHATTALCLEWLAGQDLAGCHVVDYGCGSGILGLAAARLGARAVTAVDVDPQALRATAANAKINGLAGRIVTVPPGDPRISEADVLVANILLNPLLGLVDTFSGLLHAGGRLALSGILANQAEDCSEAYTPAFEMDGAIYQDEWALLTGIRRQTA